MIEAYLTRASSYAADIDHLFDLIFWVVMSWCVLAEVVLFYFCFRFRKKEGVKAQYVTGERKQEKKWISIPHYLVLFFDVFLIAGAVAVWYNIKQHQPEAERTIRVIAQQWAWTFIHPGEDGVLHTDDDVAKVDELRLIENVTYHFELESRDVLHSFSIPVFRLKQDTIPGRKITGWFKTQATGVWDIQCTEICGIGHALMPGKVHIASAFDHQEWLSQQTPNVAGTMLASTN